jgi:CRP-like cAMP-binding protein
MNDALDPFAHDFPAGTVLFPEGVPGHVMYVVVSGVIEIRRSFGGVHHVLATLGPGEFFGEMAILSGRPRSATAVVCAPSRLLVIDGTRFEAMLRARPEIALRLIKALAGRLEATNQHVELLLQPTADHRVVQCLRHLAEEQLQRADSRPAAAPLDAEAALHLQLPVTAIFVRCQSEDIAERVGLPLAEVEGVLTRLRAARLVLRPTDAGLLGDGFIVPEVGRLPEFLELQDTRLGVQGSGER